jgi:hypothetical protein
LPTATGRTTAGTRRSHETSLQKTDGAHPISQLALRNECFLRQNPHTRGRIYFSLMPCDQAVILGAPFDGFAEGLIAELAQTGPSSTQEG